MDKDKAVGIQMFNYTEDANSDIPDFIREYQFYIWAADFNEVSPPNGALQVTSKKQMANILFNQTIEHQVFLKADVKADPLITEDYDCVFLQARF